MILISNKGNLKFDSIIEEEKYYLCDGVCYFKTVYGECTVSSDDSLYKEEIKIEVPQTITPLQAKLQLLEMNLLDEVDTLVASDRKVQLYWEYALVIERNNTILLDMAKLLQLTDEQVDNMFIQASKL